eukprot:SM000096S24855  [mRNA]  locus=s96:92146:93107:+ [translate_table: standard]
MGTAAATATTRMTGACRPPLATTAIPTRTRGHHQGAMLPRHGDAHDPLHMSVAPMAALHCLHPAVRTMGHQIHPLQGTTIRLQTMAATVDVETGMGMTIEDRSQLALQWSGATMISA